VCTAGKTAINAAARPVSYCRALRRCVGMGMEAGAEDVDKRWRRLRDVGEQFL